MNIFTATGQILNSYVTVITASARATEKGVNLIENEIDLLNEEQTVRITKVKAELAATVHQNSLEQR